MSLKNLKEVVEIANSTNDTAYLVRMMSRSPDRGGVVMVGPLIAQEILHVLSCVGIITNPIHADNAIVSRGTKTSKRLTTMGITLSDHDGLMAHISAHLKISPAVAENALCECLRWRFGTKRFYDTIAGDQSIYTMRNGRLTVFNFRGEERELFLPQWNDDGEGNGDLIEWWRRDFAPEDIAGSVVLTRSERSGTTDSKN